MFLIKLNYTNNYSDTVYFSDENIAVVKIPNSQRLYSRIFEFGEYENTSFKNIPEYRRKLPIDSNTFYFQHGLFIGQNGSDFLLIIIGKPGYIDSLIDNFDIDDPCLEEKLTIGETY